MLALICNFNGMKLFSGLHWISVTFHKLTIIQTDVLSCGNLSLRSKLEDVAVAFEPVSWIEKTFHKVLTIWQKLSRLPWSKALGLTQTSYCSKNNGKYFRVDRQRRHEQLEYDQLHFCVNKYLRLSCCKESSISSRQDNDTARKLDWRWNRLIFQIDWRMISLLSMLLSFCE